MLGFFYKLLNLVYRTLMLPITITYSIISVIYYLVFFIQIHMSSTCRGVFGDGFGCDILDPYYVFTSVLFNTIKLVCITYFFILLLRLWNQYKNT